MPNFALLALQSLASASSIFQCLSPLPSIFQAHKTQDTGELSLLPLVSLLGVCHIWMMYGYLSDNIFPLCATYLFGDAVSVLYIIAYYRYCSDKTHTRKIVALATSALALITLYAALGASGVTHQSTSQVAQVMGFAGIAMSIILYASPLETIRRVLATKSVASIPILLCVVGTVSNALWTVYGAVIGDFFVLVPNGICLVLASIQVALYVVFNPNRRPSSRDAAADLLESGSEGLSKPTSSSPSSRTSDDDSTSTSSAFKELRSPRGDK